MHTHSTIYRVMLLMATLVTVLGFMIPGPHAWAAQPERTVLVFDDALIVDDVTCDFAFEERVTGRITITTFFDQDGSLVRLHVTVSGRGEAISPNSGQTLRFVQANLFDTDLSTGERTTAGLRFLAYIPGGGVVLLDAGRLVVTDGQIVFEAGPHQLVHGDVEEFCAFLAS
jgi:hypothetical protein